MTAHRRLITWITLLLAWVFSASASAAGLSIYFFDVGQGDAILIVSPAGKTVLIDAGPPAAGKALERRLKQILSAPIDLLVMTHPHADHLGGMERVLQGVGARLFMEPGIDHPSPLYAALLEQLEQKQVPLRIGEAGRNVELGGGATLRLLAPSKPFLSGTRSDANANCIVARLTYGRTAFYFGCDSERETEKRILKSGEELSANVYKVAHHGSRHSSGERLLKRIKPEIAIVSVGANNDYGHPTRATLDRLESKGIKVYRTDLDGEILVRSNGEDISVSTERGLEGASLVIAETDKPAVDAEPAKRSQSKSRDKRASRRSKGKAGKRAQLERPVATAPAASSPATATAPAADPAPVATTKPTAVPVARTASGYVGSVNSTVFHVPGCTNAEKILPKNLVRFSTRDEAIAAGRRPARDCNP